MYNMDIIIWVYSRGLADPDVESRVSKSGAKWLVLSIGGPSGGFPWNQGPVTWGLYIRAPDFGNPQVFVEACSQASEAALQQVGTGIS